MASTLLSPQCFARKAYKTRGAVIALFSIVAATIQVSPYTWTAPAPGPRGTYTFHASRAILHLCIVPEPEPAKVGIPGPGLPDSVKPLGLFGRTIGGSFFVEWDASPWGAYREVGLLSSLVSLATGFSLGAWGAWASHVWVDSDAAAEGGRRLWGLPTSSCEIDAKVAGADGKVLAFGRAPFTSIGDGVGPLGRIDTSPKITTGLLPWASSAEDSTPTDEVLLPNLSGCLPDADPADVAAGLDCRKLLKYDIRLKPGSMRMLPGCRPDGGAGVVPRLDFSEWSPLFSVELRDIDIEVGVPKPC